MSAAAVALSTGGRGRGAAPPTPVTLKMVLVSGVGREARAHCLRGRVGDLTGVHVDRLVDVDRFGSTAAVTLEVSAAAAFGSPVRGLPAAAELMLQDGVSAWSPAVRGPFRSRQPSAEEAAAMAADLFRRRLTAKHAQLGRRLPLPPHLRAAFDAYLSSDLATHAAVGVSAPPAAPAAAATAVAAATAPAAAATAASATGRGVVGGVAAALAPAVATANAATSAILPAAVASASAAHIQAAVAAAVAARVPAAAPPAASGELWLRLRRLARQGVRPPRRGTAEPRHRSVPRMRAPASTTSARWRRCRARAGRRLPHAERHRPPLGPP